MCDARKGTSGSGREGETQKASWGSTLGREVKKQRNRGKRTVVNLTKELGGLLTKSKLTIRGGKGNWSTKQLSKTLVHQCRGTKTRASPDQKEKKNQKEKHPPGSDIEAKVVRLKIAKRVKSSNPGGGRVLL